MKIKDLAYETPKFEVLKIEVESSILAASGGNMENPVEGEESGW